MKRLIVVLILCGLAIGIAVAQPIRPMKWQDFLAKPEHDWIAKFGYSDGSHLAYHVTLLMESDRRLNVKIEHLEATIEEMKKSMEQETEDQSEGESQ